MESSKATVVLQHAITSAVVFVSKACLSCVLVVVIACGDDDGATGATGGDSGSAGGNEDSGSSGEGGSAGDGGAGSSAIDAGGAGGSAGTSGTGGTAGEPTVTPEIALTRFATALCRHYRTCLDDPYDGVVVRALGDEAACIAEKQALLEQDSRLGALLSAAREGALRITERALQTCVDATERCEQPFSVTPQRRLTYDDISPCRELFDGAVPDGGACNLSEECAGDAMCLFQAGTSGCNGTCAPRRDEDASCTVDRECAGAEGTWPVCHEQQCLQVVLEGPALFGEPCGRYQLHRARPCPGGQYCPPGAISNPRFCQPFASLNDACTPFTCGDGICLGNVCEAVTIARNEGDACGGTSICDGFAELHCDFGMCQRASGSDCSQGAWFSADDCAPRTLEPVGAACSSHATCESGVCGFTRGCLAGLCNDG